MKSTRDGTKLLSCISCAIALTGCGGGGGDAPKAPAAATCTPLAQVRIQLFGDSTQAGYEGGAVPSALAVHTPAVGLQQALDARFGASTTLVTSRAVPGTTSQQLRDGTDGTNAPWPQSVAAEIVMINHGINDMQASADAVPETMATYRANLEFFAAHTNGAQLVLETPNVVQGWAPTGTAPYAQTMRDVAKAVGAPVADTQAISDTSMLGDWAHPTDAGYVTIVSRSLAPTVAPLVAKLLCR